MANLSESAFPLGYLRPGWCQRLYARTFRNPSLWLWMGLSRYTDQSGRRCYSSPSPHGADPYRRYLFRSLDSGCWTTVGKMIVLAINSVQTERLRNTSAGVQELSTWKVSVKVREVDDGKLTFLVGDGVEGSVGLRPRPSRKYR